MSANVKSRSRLSALNSTAAAPTDDNTQQGDFLEVNPAFQEMLTALEGFDARTSSGEDRSQYEIAFYGALRTMLRECLFTAEPRADFSAVFAKFLLNTNAVRCRNTNAV